MEDTLKEIREVVIGAATNLEAVWTECGFSPEMCHHRQRKMVSHVKDLMTQMLEGEKNLMKTLVKSIDDNGSKFYHLNKELGSGIPEPEEQFTLIELERYLRRAVVDMERDVKARHKRLEDLRSQEQELCECLKEEVSVFEKKAVPSKESIKDLERMIKTLEQEKVDRKKTFYHQKDNLDKILRELEQSPGSSFECSVVSGMEDLFVLSTENLRRLKVLNEEYERRVEDNRRESVELQEKIRQLCDRLGHDPGGRDQLLATMAGHTPSSLHKLREELELLEKAKRENMERFISQLKQELEEVWEKCYVGEEEKEAFTPYVSGECTEEVLEAHTVEVERLKKHLQENKKLFAALDHWHQLWSKHLSLEERSNNPNRLFGNRGCALLQEEKERRRVRGELPRVEKEVEDLAKSLEERSGTPFLVKGQAVGEYVLDHWHRYHDQRNLEKKERQSARTKQLLHETRLGSKQLSAVSFKRQMAPEGSIRRAKQRRLQENSSPDPSSTSTICLTPQHLRSRGILREHNQKPVLSIAAEKSDNNASSQDSSTYSNFSNTLHLRSRRENIRSSAVYGVSRTPGPSHRTSPRRPQGLPRTPKTLPRIATRRSPRLNASRMRHNTGRNATQASPGLSAAFRSPLHRSSLKPATNTNTTTTPSRWSKVSFLI